MIDSLPISRLQGLARQRPDLNRRAFSLGVRFHSFWRCDESGLARAKLRHDRLCWHPGRM